MNRRFVLVGVPFIIGVVVGAAGGVSLDRVLTGED